MKTVLGDRHQELGAKMIEFCGWQMPLSYQGILAEHQAVRQHVGIFDVSHMGRILIQGEEAEVFLNFLGTNDIVHKQPFTAVYTVFCHENGGSVDDALIYKQSPQECFVVVNASNREKDLNHIKKYADRFQVQIKETYSEEGILAIQGPESKKLLKNLFGEAVELKPMHFTLVDYVGHQIVLSATGYTGAGGYEIYAPNAVIPELWQKITAAGAVPCGLGARDTLRLEKGYALYGHELSDEITPTESVSAWTVKWTKDFLGKEALMKLENSASKRAEYGMVLQGEGIAREGCIVYNGAIQIGKVTSGTYSPSLNKAIAIILVQAKLSEGDTVEVQIRNHKVYAKIVSLPFLK